MDTTNLETPPSKTPTFDAENKTPNQLNTPPPQNQTKTEKTQSPICNSGKNGTPDRLKVPKAFKYQERYTSPTDQMVSPITRGILARSRKGSKLLPPSLNQPKIEGLQFRESGLVRMEKS
ncbi:hypothetical protein CDL12_12838 [Handroanthus impetiginosus]|uniref:Uncharacterized protein n=1 Tax=Handroanthus impetiginosus TaxID=429701 RepID=A0A2G9HAJ2_9LAMI|nr:hypothetical protein CDL12_12838 [Handroanthus impetiginosus]